MSEYRKQAQMVYKTWNYWVGKGIHRELCKKLEFDHTTKRYMHRLVFVFKNETHKIHWDFAIQIDHLISARRPDFELINKKKKKGKPPQKLAVLWTL